MAEDKIEKEEPLPAITDIAEGSVLKMNRDELHLAKLGYKQGTFSLEASSWSVNHINACLTFA